MESENEAFIVTDMGSEGTCPRETVALVITVSPGFGPSLPYRIERLCVPVVKKR
jgi:hypothetical protein